MFEWYYTFRVLFDFELADENNPSPKKYEWNNGNFYGGNGMRWTIECKSILIVFAYSL